MFTLGARARLSLGTKVNTPFFQGPTPEFGHGEYKVETLYSGTKMGVGYPVSEHSNILCRCPGTSARASSVNMA